MNVQLQRAALPDKHILSNLMQLYQYDFSEPWNGPKNQKLAVRMPHVYACPADTTGGRLNTMTNYVAVRRPATTDFVSADGSKSACRPREVLVVELARSGIHWMEPVAGTRKHQRFRHFQQFRRQPVQLSEGAGGPVLPERSLLGRRCVLVGEEFAPLFLQPLNFAVDLGPNFSGIHRLR